MTRNGIYDFLWMLTKVILNYIMISTALLVIFSFIFDAYYHTFVNPNKEDDIGGPIIMLIQLFKVVFYTTPLSLALAYYIARKKNTKSIKE